MDKNEKTKNDGTPVEKEAQKPNAGNDKKAPTKGKTVFTVIVAVLALLMLGGALYLNQLLTALLRARQRVKKRPSSPQ